jgi:hypothetical protein
MHGHPYDFRGWTIASYVGVESPCSQLNSGNNAARDVIRDGVLVGIFVDVIAIGHNGSTGGG